MTENDRSVQKALLRFKIISAYLAQNPPRGQRRAMLEHLSKKDWMLETGEIVRVKADTIRYWIRRYRNGGFEALKDKPRSDKGCRTIPKEYIETACSLKQQVPERTIDRIIAIMENLQLSPPGVVRRSTLHRALQAKGLSQRKLKPPEKRDLDRFAADYANDLWQSDMLQGPWLPDTEKRGKMRRTYLYAFVDDASRLVLYGRFFFKGDLPALELVFKRSLQRYGKPGRVYYDNAKVYRANHMRLICAELNIHRPIHTKAYRPEGHGKIEAFNRFCVTNFIAEVKASSIRTLDQLNQAFFAFIDVEYNRRRHSELAMSPKQRWLKDASRITYLEEEKIRTAFLWRELRTADKTGVIRLFNHKYKVTPDLARKKVEVRYDPERLEQIEIYLNGTFVQRAKPLSITAHRAPKQTLPKPEPTIPSTKTDYLGWLTQQHKRKRSVTQENPKSDASAALTQFTALLCQHIDPKVFDQKLCAEFFNTYGPFDIKKIKHILDTLLAVHPNNLHTAFYLEHIQYHLIGDTL
jgi:transposase InsO family protein